MNVYILFIGSGEDGDETRLEKVFSTKELAEKELATYPARDRQDPWPRCFVEEWPVEGEQ